MELKLKVEKVVDNAIIPSKREEDAGYDLYGFFEQEDVFLKPNDIILVRSGIKIEFDKNFVFFITERSSCGCKGISTRAGVIDSGFRGEIKIPINNLSNNLIIFSNNDLDFLIKKYPFLENEKDKITVYPQNKAIAQALILYSPHFEIVEEKVSLNSQRLVEGFGSTNK